ncbi:MtrB/PioB family outer membrane beta-barrel protein [Candidatus Magnetominusculus dajiuhuensis]|uniref:MtrB/PioB family outer membrane beta-barrel protein n=1 Tax=Candidatus Magnetominusculus dajiuhuensis TaxID=3137712 RepID=UPI003B431FAC
MKAKLVLFAIFLILLPFGVAVAEDTTGASKGDAADICGDACILKIPNLHGEITMSGQLRPLQGNSTKYNEYRDDYRGNLFGDITLKYDTETFWINLKAEDIGYDTQKYRVDGGMYGIFKAYVEYSEFPHNYSLGDKSIYNGAGTNYLTLIPNYRTSPYTSWNDLDYKISRQKEAAGARIDVLKPFYIDFNAERVDRTGTRPMSNTNSQSSSGPITEFPQVVDYVTSMFKGEVGYATKPIFASAYLQYTDFNNGDTDMYYQNVYTANLSTSIASRAGLLDTYTLPASNQNLAYGLKVSAELPLNSRINASMSNSHTTSQADFFLSSLIGTTIATPTPVWTPAIGRWTWYGKAENQAYNVVLTSNPITNLNVNAWYKYRSLKNNSDDPEFSSSLGNAEQFIPVDYYKSEAGAEASYKLPFHIVASAGYNYVITHNTVDINTGTAASPYLASGQMTYDVPTTSDSIYNFGLKWSGFDFVTAKVSYERMNRNGSPDATIWTATDAYAPYKNEFDTGSQKRDKIKASLDFYPIESLDIGLGYNYKKSIYPDTEIGLINTRTDEYYIDAGYTFGKYARLNTYVAYEKYRTYQFFRNAAAGNQDPNSPVISATGVVQQNQSNYNWDYTQTEKSVDFGASVDVYLIPKKLTLVLGYDNVHSYGNGGFNILNSAAQYTLDTPANTLTSNIVPFQDASNMGFASIDSYKLERLSAKIAWKVMKPLTMTVGYAYERYKYDDYGYNDYPSTYTITDASGNVNYLSGMYSNPSYNANLYFLTLSYKF